MEKAWPCFAGIPGCAMREVIRGLDKVRCLPILAAMKRSPLPFFAAMLCSLAFLTPPASAANEWDVAQIDALLAAQEGDMILVGDMLFRRDTLEAWRAELAGAPAQKGGIIAAAAASSTAPLWTGGNVYYAFNGNVSAIHRRAFLDAAAEWEAFANIRFIARTAEPNYIMVNDGGAGLSGGNSAVGMVGGAQALNIGSNSWNRGTLCHEIGHALGLVHEHQRSDRNSFVTIQTASIIPGTESNFVLLPSSNNQGAYDFLSVMHYRRDTFSTNPGVLDTIAPLPAYTGFIDEMGRSYPRILSTLDRAGIAALYGAPTPLPGPVVTNTKDSGSGSLRAAIYYAADHPGTTVSFQIPLADPGFAGGVFTIRPTDFMTGPDNNTTIDATTQTAFTGDTNPAGPEVVLSGQVSPATDQLSDGLIFADANCTVRGVAVQGFAKNGVLFTGAGSTGNKLCGCYVGTNAAGTTAVPNGLNGVEFRDGAHGNTVGGAGAGDGNVLSGNTDRGVLMVDAGTMANTVRGNIIGLTATGGAALPNADEGIGIFAGGGGNVIGPDNVISGNTRYGVIVVASTGTVIAGNKIGTDPAGALARGNGFAGIGLFNGAANSVIGPDNVISGNGNQGIAISEAGSDGTVVRGNRIGTNAAGTAAIANTFGGVAIFSGAKNSVIGGAVPGAGNVISGNGNSGVTISGAEIVGTIVAGNFIGTDASGGAALANNGSGVGIFGGATGTTIGGGPGARNIISGNASVGVLIGGSGTDGNIVVGNTIGLDRTAALGIGNAFGGIQVNGGALGNRIGGPGVGDSNIISANGGDGISIFTTATARTTISGNSIFDNAFRGIALYDSSNESQAAPSLSSAVLGIGTAIQGTLASTPNATFRIEFFSVPTADGSGQGEGRTFLGSTNVTTSGAGSATINFTSGVVVPAGELVAATATNAAGSTSNFSATRIVTTTDTDGDGLPDAYETANGLSTTVADANIDHDGDGQTTGAEFIAGTDPRNSASRITLTAVNVAGADFAVDLSTVAGRVYRIEKRLSFGTATPWLPFVDQIPGTGATIRITDPGAEANTSSFYRGIALP